MPKAFHSARYQRFCELLAEERRRAALTQAALAHRLGKPQSYVAKYEGGERRLDIVEFLDVASAIGFDPNRIIRALRAG